MSYLVLCDLLSFDAENTKVKHLKARIHWLITDHYAVYFKLSITALQVPLNLVFNNVCSISVACPLMDPVNNSAKYLQRLLYAIIDCDTPTQSAWLQVAQQSSMVSTWAFSRGLQCLQKVTPVHQTNNKIWRAISRNKRMTSGSL